MQFGGPLPDNISLSVQLLGTVLFCVAFLFLWSRSRIVFFAFWSIAWAMQSLALVFAFLYFKTFSGPWLAFYVFFEGAFGVFLIAAARVGPAGSGKHWRSSLKLLVALPVLLVVLYVVNWKLTLDTYHGFHALLIGIVYFYSYLTIRGSSRAGGKFFRFSLLFLSLAFLEHSFMFFYTRFRGPIPAGVWLFQNNAVYDIILHSMLVFAAMAMWIESQTDRIQQIGDELDRVRRESLTNMDLDRLTGLLNQAALARRMDDPQGFKGVVAVCDMDGFKQVNDHYGHLVGDEILRAVGHLVRSSIRHEDEAFRWGGDEFVILFQNQNTAIVRHRMEELQVRLQDFRVRGYGALPVSFSWGMAEADGRPLRQPLDNADQEMYNYKRRRAAADPQC